MAEPHPKEPEGKTREPAAEELARMVDREIAELQRTNPRLNVVLFKKLIGDVLGTLMTDAERAGDPGTYFKHVTTDHEEFRKKTGSMLLDAMLRRCTKSRP